MCIRDRCSALPHYSGVCTQKKKLERKVFLGNIYKFFRNLEYNKEARNNKNFAQEQKLIAKACGISVKLIQHIKSPSTLAKDQDMKAINLIILTNK